MRISDWSSVVCSSDLPRADLGGDPAVALAQRPALAAAAGGQVAAELVALRDPRPAVVDRLAVAEQAPLVAVDDLRQVALQNGSESCRERVCQDVQISVVGIALYKQKIKKR